MKSCVLFGCVEEGISRVQAELSPVAPHNDLRERLSVLGPSDPGTFRSHPTFIKRIQLPLLKTNLFFCSLHLLSFLSPRSSLSQSLPDHQIIIVTHSLIYWTSSALKRHRHSLAAAVIAIALPCWTLLFVYSWGIALTKHQTYEKNISNEEQSREDV